MAVAAVTLVLSMILTRMNYNYGWLYKCLTGITNLTVRLTCIFLIEILISVAVTFKSSKNTGLAACAAIFLLSLIALLLSSLLFGCGIGPHRADGSIYEKGTFWRSCFERRPMIDNASLIKLVTGDKSLLKFALE